MNIVNTLKVIVDNPRIHACWLNSLSYLEYRGFRKIIRSRTTKEISLQILIHSAEEVRHSVFFKRQAVKIGGNDFIHFAEESLLASQALKNYFYKIDARTMAAIEGVQGSLLSEAAYSVITWLVETRALSLYEEYEKILRASSAQFSLSSILREESLHLKEIGISAARFLLEQGFDLQFIAAIEKSEFEKLWIAIQESFEVRP
ncbi:MAG TPA: hypothetical protein VIG33_03925 [Pseudobdellovibrionaceae bacterium]|jgi:hypothetical protein